LRRKTSGLFENNPTAEADALRGVSRPGGADAALAQIRSASELASGFPDLAQRQALLEIKSRVARAFVSRARWATAPMYESYPYVKGYLSIALELDPVNAPGGAVSVVRYTIQALVDKHTDASQIEGRFSALVQIIESLNLKFAPEELAALLNFADATRSPEQWKTRIKKLSARPG